MSKENGSPWDEELPAIVIPRDDRGGQIQVKRVRMKGKWYVDVRGWYVDRGTGDLRPGKGIAIPDDLADEVAEAIIETGTSGTPR